MKGIQVYSNEEPRLSPRGGNRKIVKLYLKYLKIFLFRTTRVISTKLGTNHPWVEGFKFVQMQGHVLLEGEIIMK